MSSLIGVVNAPVTMGFKQSFVVAKKVGEEDTRLGPINGDGSYGFGVEEAWSYEVSVYPDANLPVTGLIYGVRGWGEGAPVPVPPGTTELDLSLEAAGYLDITVQTAAGKPAAGAQLLILLPDASGLAMPPRLADSSGKVLLPNVPLQTKVFVCDSEGSHGVFYAHASLAKKATRVVIKKQGATKKLKVTLPST